MNAFHFMRAVVLVVGIAAVVKGVWMLASPGSAARVARWFMERPGGMLRVIGAIAFTLGIACIIAAAMTAPAVVAATLVIGTLWICAGLMYHSPETIRTVMRPWTSGNVVWMRITGVISLLIALGLLWIVYRAW